MKAGVVQELCEIQTREELLRWAEQREITLDLLRTAAAPLGNLVHTSALTVQRLSDWISILAERLDDPNARALALRSRGIALVAIRQPSEALRYFDMAIQILEDTGGVLEAARIRMNRAVVYGQISRFDDAIRDSQAVVEVFEKHGQMRLVAKNYSNLAVILSDLDRYGEAIEAMQKAEVIFDRLGDTANLAAVYMNMGVAFDHCNVPSKSLHFNRLAADLAKQCGLDELAGTCEYNIACLYAEQSQYAKALDLLNGRCAAISDRWTRGNCDLTQSEIYLKINLYREAYALAEKAYARFQEVDRPHEMAKALAAMGIAAGRFGEHRKAIDVLQRARSMFREYGNKNRAAAMDMHQAMLLLLRGEYAEARALSDRASDDLDVLRVEGNAILAKIISSRASAKLGDFNRAWSEAAKALELFTASPSPALEPWVHAQLGEIRLGQGDFEGARSDFKKAIEALETVRLNIQVDDLRLSYFQDKVTVYELLVTTDLRLGQPALREAFETIERAKSRTLVDLLSGNVQEYVQRAASSTVEEIQESLSTEAALVEYFAVGDDLIAFVVTRNRFDVLERIASASRVKKVFELLRFQTARFGLGGSHIERHSSTMHENINHHLHELFDMLMSSICPLIEDKKHVIFVPHDFLHYLPFHALFDGTRHLIERFGVSYAPSATIYRMIAGSERKVADGAALIGFSDSRVPFIEDEIQGIQEAIPAARTYTGEGAILTHLRRELESARLIHIAAHASYRTDNPMFSSIALSDKALNFYDIYNLKTNADLITLSGCGTGLGNVVAGDELLGLVRGFLYAGARSVLVSLWDVNDRTTATLMKSFYRHLASGLQKIECLRLAMLETKAAFPHPYYWAPFLLVGNFK